MIISCKPCKNKVIYSVLKEEEELDAGVDYLRQVQSTYMSKRARTSVFTFGELMNIVSGLILFLMPESSTLHTKTSKDSILLAFYMDDIFGAFKTYQKQYMFLHNYFFLRMVWSKLKLTFSNLKIGITKIFALEK